MIDNVLPPVGFAPAFSFTPASATPSNPIVDSIIMDRANKDTRIRRSATKTVTIDDNAGGNVTLNVGTNFSLSPAGTLSVVNVGVGNTGAFSWGIRSLLLSPADGNIQLSNNAVTGFGLLQFGGTSNAFPAIKKNANAFQLRFADDSGFTDIDVGNLFMNNGGNFMARTKAAWANGAAANVGTLGNAPAVGNPTKWIPVDDNGTTRYVPAW